MDTAKFSRKLKRERNKRGLGPYDAANFIGIAPNVLRTLEGDNHVRKSNPARVRIDTALLIMEAYFPAFQFKDFGFKTDLVIVHKNGGARR